MATVTRPKFGDITDKSLHDRIAVDGLTSTAADRLTLKDLLEYAKKKNQSVAVACIRFALANSFDHHEPYKHEEAVELLSKALDDFPTWPEAIFNRAVAKIHASDFEGAISDLRHAEELLFVPGEERILPGHDPALLHGMLLMFLAEAMVGRNQEGDFELARVMLIRSEIQLRASKDPSSQTWLKQFDQRLSGTISKASSSLTQFVRSPGSFVLGVVTGFLLLISIANIDHQENGSEAHRKNNDSTSNPENDNSVVNAPQDSMPDKDSPAIQGEPVSSSQVLDESQSTRGVDGQFTSDEDIDNLFGESLAPDSPEH